MTLNVSQTILVMCVAKGLPQPNITWLRNGNPIMNNSLHTVRERYEKRDGMGTVVVGTLEICPDAAGGQYSCRAQNEYTFTDAPFIVTIPGIIGSVDHGPP